MTSIKKIKNNLKGLNNYEVVIFGSLINRKYTKRSDIDSAVITRIKNREKNKEIWFNLLNKVTSGYDLKVFELLPLPMQISIADGHIVIFGDSLEISEYFYHFRKLWKDVEKRYKENQFASIKEKKEALQRIKYLGIEE